MPIFDGCCNEEDLEFDCPCTDNVPIAMTTVFVEFDINSMILQEENFEGELTFTCCSGNQTLAAIQSEGIFPTGFGVVFDVVSSVNRTFEFTINFQNQSAYNLVPSNGNFTIYYTACGQQISQQVNWTLIDSCESSIPVLEPVTINWDITTDDGATEDVVIDLSELVCCGVPEQAVIEALSTISPTTGVTYTGFPVGYGFVGIGTIPLSFEFDSGDAASPTSFTFYADIKVCNEFIIRQIVYFVIIETPPIP